MRQSVRSRRSVKRPIPLVFLHFGELLANTGRRSAVTDSPARDRDLLVHEFKNHMSVIVGFCDLLLREMPEGDVNRASILEIERAALAVVALLPRIPGQEPSADV